MLHHKAKPVCGMLVTVIWEALPHVAYSPDFAPSDYHLFALAEQCFSSYRDIKKLLDEWFAAKGEDFY
jgi:hypothetical protein